MLAALAMSVFMLAGCKKDTNPSGHDGNEPLSGTADDEECVFGFSPEELQNIGSEHNRIVNVVFNHYLPHGSTDLRDALNRAYEENKFEPISEDEFEKLQSQYSESNIESTTAGVIEGMSNEAQKQIFNDMVTAVTENTNNYEELANQINLLKERAYAQLTCYELTATLVALEVCQNSAKLWLSQDAGGQGYFDIIDEQISERSSGRVQARGFWSRLANVVIGDAVGAFSGFVAGATPYLLTGGAANPISNAVLAAHTIRGAVQGSVMAGVSNALH